jgi:hypothetical protein
MFADRASALRLGVLATHVLSGSFNPHNVRKILPD